MRPSRSVPAAAIQSAGTLETSPPRSRVGSGPSASRPESRCPAGSVGRSRTAGEGAGEVEAGVVVDRPELARSDEKIGVPRRPVDVRKKRVGAGNRIEGDPGGGRDVGRYSRAGVGKPGDAEVPAAAPLEHRIELVGSGLPRKARRQEHRLGRRNRRPERPGDAERQELGEETEGPRPRAGELHHPPPPVAGLDDGWRGARVGQDLEDAGDDRRGGRDAQTCLPLCGAQIFLLVNQSSTVKSRRKRTPVSPAALRAIIEGSAAHIRKADTSSDICSTLATVPSA